MVLGGKNLYKAEINTSSLLGFIEKHIKNRPKSAGGFLFYSKNSIYEKIANLLSNSSDIASV